MKLIEPKDGTIIEAFVKPNQPKFKITIANDEILISSTEETVKGKVNKEIIKELSRLFHAKVELVSGSTSRHKTLLIKNTKKTQIEQLLHNQSP